MSDQTQSQVNGVVQPKVSVWKKVFSPQMLIVFVLGFASGLPLAMTGATLKQWLAQEKIDMKTIGFFSAVGIAYSFKYMWSPLLDRYFFSKVGRRKTWMLITQVLLVAGMIMMGLQSPTTGIAMLAFWATFVAFMSATQDIAIDAYRREFLTNEEIGLGSSMSIYGYRIAMLVSGGLGVSFVTDAVSTAAAADAANSAKITWPQLYYALAAVMGLCALITFFIPEPKSESAPRSLLEAVVEPFKEFFKRPEALILITFVFAFKLGDQIALSLLTPFYKAMGYQNFEIGLIAKTYGLFSTLAGLFVGGVAIIKYGIKRSLYVFGALQGISTASFAIITYTGPKIWSLSFAVLFEDFSSGMGTAAFTAFLASITNKKFTATQFAVLTSVATLGRTVFSSFAGVLQESVGWANFFYLGGILSIPGLVLLWWLSKTKFEVT